MPVDTTRKSGLKKERHALAYDSDILGQTRIIRVDIIISDGKTDIITPVTDSYRARFVEGDPAAIPKREFTPRALLCCFSYQQEKEVTRTVYNPYLPNNVVFLTLIKELISYNGVVSLDYSGESKEKEIEEWL